MKKGFRFLAAFILSALWAFSLYASEKTTEDRTAAYRLSTLEELVVSSHRETIFVRSAADPHDEKHFAFFPIEKNDLFRLEPDNIFFGDAVEA